MKKSKYMVDYSFELDLLKRYHSNLISKFVLIFQMNQRMVKIPKTKL